jgi:ribonuclease VapC
VIVDTSALAAIVFREDGFESLINLVTDEGASAATPATALVELGIVLSNRLEMDARPIVNQLVEHLGLEVIPFTSHHMNAAVGAYKRFGRGRHRAGLSFGDCFSYAVASISGEPLLFVGDDFSHTDIEAA